ncbi:RNA polymerase sigma factor [Sorangium sp. So ce388]|uniref:RNA polymerase sigma factor n=1 Tax=Sorangium sp. So ce388 TaxID=3133309 RepID=UPI003F5B5A57
MKQIDLVDIIIVDSFARHADRLAEDTDFAAWLFTIARNRYRSHRRSAVLDLARAVLFSREPAPVAPGPEGAADARAEVATLEGALRSLAAGHREVLLLGAVEGLEAAQVAMVLGIREDAARKRQSPRSTTSSPWYQSARSPETVSRWLYDESSPFFSYVSSSRSEASRTSICC